MCASNSKEINGYQREGHGRGSRKCSRKKDISGPASQDQPWAGAEALEFRQYQKVAQTADSMLSVLKGWCWP